ncbi:MAG TPA: site-specific integrase [Methylotenera sp.]|mgnify:CR=1 FL=1|nr:site-specific integrase [Methylotenera sp.]HPN02361.1 site-specific integrase [Methylotenera sp.]
MATIRQQDNGKWQAVVRKKGVKASEVFSSKSDAKKWGQQTETDIERGVFVDASKSSITFEAVCETYMSTSDFLSLKSKTKLSCLNKLITLIGNKPMNKIDAALLTKLKNDFSKPVTEGGDGYSAETVIRYLNTISSIFTYAKNELEIPVVMPFVKKPAKPQGRDQRITDEEIDLIVDSTHSLALKTALRLLIETGMRRSELANLTWQQVKYPLIKLTDTKNGERRDVPLSKKAVELLKALPHRIDGLVLGVRPGSLTRAFVRARKPAGLEHIRLHDSRHEAISRLSKKVPNVIELAAISGHKDLQMLKRYYHTDPLELAKKLG